MIDRELYLPACWTNNPQRLAAAGVPDDVGFATKPALAAGMVTRALQAGVPARWVAGDEVYSADPRLRAELEYHRIGYVLGVGCDRTVATPAGALRADEVATRIPTRAWQQLSAGSGAKGERVYNWAYTSLVTPEGAAESECWWLLIRRNRSTGELAFYRCYSPHLVPLRELVRVAGRRWTIEETFQAAKGLTGLDQHQVRTWTSWRRWTLLTMIAHALLAVIAADERLEQPTPHGLIALTCNEIRRLFTTPAGEPRHTHACPTTWSLWRRRHQHRSRTSHYHTRQARTTT